MSNGSVAWSGLSVLVSTCGSIPWWRATKSGRRGISQRTAKDGRTLIRTARTGARTVTARAAAAICSSAGRVSA